MLLTYYEKKDLRVKKWHNMWTGLWLRSASDDWVGVERTLPTNWPQEYRYYFIMTIISILLWCSGDHPLLNPSRQKANKYLEECLFKKLKVCPPKKLESKISADLIFSKLYELHIPVKMWNYRLKKLSLEKISVYGFDILLFFDNDLSSQSKIANTNDKWGWKFVNLYTYR